MAQPAEPRPGDAADEWPSACSLLSLAGLRWSKVDLEHGIVTISHGSALVDTTNLTEGEPNCRNSARHSAPTGTWPNSNSALEPNPNKSAGPANASRGTPGSRAD